MARMRVLALDFVGTLAGHGPAPDGRFVADVLRGLPGAAVPEEFPARFDAVTRQLRAADHSRRVRTPFATRLGRAVQDCGATVPDLRRATEAVFTALPDATVDPRAAAALRDLRASGLTCVLAANTDRPEPVRRRTLRDAGIADCFDALVLSGTLGIRKPDRRFYAEVTRAAECPAGDILFVGDNAETDALGPHAYGMSAVLVTPGPRPDALPGSIATIPHLSHLARHLNRAAFQAS
ncbi:HAD family hydrolase [Streptomyces xanthochromogenes]|uniref:HAD family hydrolase n=1 Tax=Streptomyces xanthochromogenes TaxID=67384 RepID=UPI003808EC43